MICYHTAYIYKQKKKDNYCSSKDNQNGHSCIDLKFFVVVVVWEFSSCNGWLINEIARFVVGIELK